MARRKIEEAAPPQEMSEPIHTKYRPRKLDDVVGQGAVVKSLSSALKDKARPHCFLFTGPAGTGKTTLARIVASEFGCDLAGLIEVDAASTSGIDDMRTLTGSLRYNGFGDTPNKAVIIDEAHALSKQAWDSLLKTTEEPPPHVFFFFCSTNPAKIPAAMVTRCLAYNLKPVKFEDIMDLLEDIAEREDYDTPQRILSLVAQAAEGSPRQALTMLAAVHACEDEDEAAALLAQPLDNKEIIDLCRQMLRGDLEWRKLCETLKQLDDSPESIRIVIVNYLSACLLGSKSEKETLRLLDMLECFLKPCNPTDKLAPILVAFGRYIFD